jgi:CheY-like chemotaxis protein
MDEQHRESLSIINASGSHLLALINDILDLSKIEAGHMTLLESELPLHTTLQDIDKMFQMPAQEKLLSLTVKGIANLPVQIITDASKLRQIVINLIGNAIKFTASGSISCQCSARRFGTDNYRLCIAVTDTGQGIAAAEYNKVFSSFEQTESGLNTEGGTGLGLALSREYARLLGGDISFSSAVGEGSCFTFTAVVKAGAGGIKTRSEKAIGIMEQYTPPKVLVVDDKEPDRRLIRLFLEPLGFELIEAENGIEAIESFEQNRPDLILMDYRMPIMDGGEATQRIKTTERGEKTAIIAMSASVLTTEIDVILGKGADASVPKPIKREDLLQCIAEQLGIEYRYEDPSFTATAGAKPIDQRDSSSERPATVLVVDDSKINRMVACMILKKEGYHCEEAIDGRDALDKVAALSPDVILLDMMMPVMDGYEVLKTIDRKNGMPVVPIIASTANSDEQENATLMQLGAIAVCPKPLQANVLKATVINILARQEQTGR